MRKVNYDLLDAVNAAGLSLAELTRRAGLASKHIYSIANGRCVLTVSVANKIKPFLPTYDTKKALLESGTVVYFKATLNPACKMIVDLMEKENLNQRVFASKIGIACSSLNELLSGDLKLSQKTADKIQAVFKEFDAAKAIEAQTEKYGKSCSNKTYREKWKLQQLQN